MPYRCRASRIPPGSPFTGAMTPRAGIENDLDEATGLGHAQQVVGDQVVERLESLRRVSPTTLRGSLGGQTLVLRPPPHDQFASTIGRRVEVAIDDGVAYTVRIVASTMPSSPRRCRGGRRTRRLDFGTAADPHPAQCRGDGATDVVRGRVSEDCGDRSVY